VVAPSTSALLTQWNWAPSVVLGILLMGGAYIYAAGPLRRRHGWQGPTRAQLTWFALSDVVLVIALLSPLDAISDQYLFSAHMVQHLLLATVWPPLVLMALTPWMVRPIFRSGIIAPFVSFLTYPAIALVLFNIDVYLWHIPAMYNATLQHENVHILEHVTFMFFGLLNWWPLLSPLRELRLSYPFQILYLFLDGMFMMVLGIVFTFSPVVFYSAYSSAPRLWGLSALTDQQIGGLVMWYPGNLPYAVLLAVAFYRWFDGGDEFHETDLASPSQSPTINSPRPEVSNQEA
jgi:cytochrome c oxidase assembly factor CtaG